jgi:hypothetical protein
MCRHDELAALADLKPHPRNPNRHPPHQVVSYAAIMKAHGVRQPVRVSKLSGYVTKGHGQMLGAVAAGWTHVPIEFHDYESEAHELADLVADNALGRQSEIDWSMVMGHVELEGLPFDPAVFGVPLPASDGQEVAFQAKDGALELGEGEFQNFAHKCGKCGFEYGDPK